MNELPIELWEYIATLTGSYRTYVNLALAGPAARTKRLVEPQRVLRVKRRLTRCTIDKYETCWRLDGKLHRDDDQPALITVQDVRYWFQHGREHRDNDQPALISSHGKHWYQRGKRHRDGGQPAIIWSDGDLWWYQNDKRCKRRK